MREDGGGWLWASGSVKMKPREGGQGTNMMRRTGWCSSQYNTNTNQEIKYVKFPRIDIILATI
jgi:hypothetical protein